MAWHDELTGADAIHDIMFVQSSDPGAVGPFKFWLDTTGGASLETGAILKQRDAGDSAWVTRCDLSSVVGGIPETIADAKGDLIVATAADTVAKLTVGANNTQPVADSAQATGIKWQRGIANGVAALVDGATITWDFAGYYEMLASVTLGGNRTLDFSNIAAGCRGTLIVKQDGTGARTLTLPAGSIVRDTGAGAITLSTAAGSIDMLSFVYDGTNYLWVYGVDFT